MDVSDRANPNGSELIQTIVTLTAGEELPEQWVRGEVGKMLDNVGHSDDTLTLDQLRHAVIAYLQMLEEEESRWLESEAPPESVVTALPTAAIRSDE